jgi:hypothetical protein
MRGDNTPDIIIMNCGLHDAGSVSSPSIYASNLKQYVQAAQSTGAELFWQTTTAIKQDKQPEEWRHITSNSKVLVMNKIATTLMHAHGIPVLDANSVSNFPNLALHSDAMHLHNRDGLYYHTIRDIFVGVYCLKRRQREPQGDMPLWWSGSTESLSRKAISVGCYQDQWPNPRFGFMALGWHDEMSPQLCAANCAGGYIGLEMGFKCFCSLVVSNETTLSQVVSPLSLNECAEECIGDASQKCGGSDMRLSIYRLAEG